MKLKNLIKHWLHPIYCVFVLVAFVLFLVPNVARASGLSILLLSLRISLTLT